MTVVLLTDVKGHGKKGDLVEASDGFARNFLIPKKMAKPATQDVLNDLRGRSESQAYHKEQELKAARELAQKLEGASVTIAAKAGDGKLFGKITAQNVADAVKYQLHVAIDKRKIQLQDGIKELGESRVEIKVHPGISAKIVVKVEKE